MNETDPAHKITDRPHLIRNSMGFASWKGGQLPGNEAAMKLLYLVLNRAIEESKRPPREWCEAKTKSLSYSAIGSWSDERN
jgi:transposase-like protein